MTTTLLVRFAKHVVRMCVESLFAPPQANVKVGQMPADVNTNAKHADTHPFPVPPKKSRNVQYPTTFASLKKNTRNEVHLG